MYQFISLLNCTRGSRDLSASASFTFSWLHDLGEYAYVSQSSNFIQRTMKTLNQSVPQSCKIWAQLLKPFATLHGSFQDACSQFLVLLDPWVTESHSSGFVPSALSPGSSKCALCTESWGAHTQRERQMATNLLAFKKIPVWLLQQSSGRRLCPEERKQVKKSRTASSDVEDSANLAPPTWERAAGLLLSKGPSSLGSEWNKSLGKSLFSLVSAPLGAKQLCWTF